MPLINIVVQCYLIVVTTQLAVILLLALLGTSIANAFVAYFVCKLVADVAKIKASSSIYDYRAMHREETGKEPAELPEPEISEMKQEPVGDGTLSSQEAHDTIRAQL